MKKILLAILFIVCLPFQVIAFDPVMEQIITDSGGAAACVKDTSTLIYNQTATTGSWAMTSGAQAAGQNITAAPFDLYSITIYFDAPSSCVATVRAGTSANLGTYVEEWININVGTDAGILPYEFVSVSNDTYTAIYWGVAEVSGGCNIRYSTGNPIASSDFRYGDGGGTDWNMDFVYTDDRDLQGLVHKCE